MKKIFTIPLLILLLFLYSISAVAQEYTDTTRIPDLTDILPSLSSQERAFLQSDALTHVSKKIKETRLKYVPQGPIFSETHEFVENHKPTILYESLVFLPEPDPYIREKLLLSISNVLRDIPIFSTIEYQNLKDGNIHPIFNSSDVVASLNDDTIIDPPTPLTAIPNHYTEDTVYAKQDMPPFGHVIFRYRYRYDNHYSKMLGNNTTPIHYSNFRAVKPNDMFISYWTIHTTTGLLIYGLGAVKISGIANLLKAVISNSFVSRTVGLFTWMHTYITATQETLYAPAQLSSSPP